MKFCDLTIAYNERSGGIRTYIDEKRRFLNDHTEHEHLLIIPGDKDAVERDGRHTTVYLQGPLLPNQDHYRFFLSPGPIKEALAEHQPDIVELGSYYIEPWAAFSYRRRRREAGKPCLLGGYFHTDVAEAYVAAPLKAAAHGWLDDVSEALGNVAEKIADVAAAGAEQYMRYVFRHCDVSLAAAPAQAERLQTYGVEDVKIAPMGVDLRLFDPARRSEEVRRRLGAGPKTLVLAYAGRLSTEKRVTTLVKALEKLPRRKDVQLWMIGDGPMRDEMEEAARQDPRIRLLPHERDRSAFSEMLASSDIYVTAGPHETFALSVIEAQACALPAVGVDAGALKERLGDGLGFLGAVDDADAMAANILQAEKLRSTIGPAARRHVVEKFSWASGFRKLLAHYANGAELTPKPPTSRSAEIETEAA